MFVSLIRKVVGSKNNREIKRLRKIVAQINALEPNMEALSDQQIQEKTIEFRERYNNGETLDKLLVEAFAVVREASKRVMGMRHFDVQMIGGMALNSGKVAEMRTGEGKTLVATLAVYLNAIPAKGVHVVTVNDYLARRDAEWMRPLYEALGMSVGVVVSQQDGEEKRAAYQADITYGTNNELGFDYLRDNMAFTPVDRFQRGHHFAVVDEVDSILIDEARTPLIISGPAEDSSELYIKVNKLIPGLTEEIPEAEGQELVPGDYVLNLKDKAVELTESGHEKVEQLLVENGLLVEGESLYAPHNLLLFHHVNAALRAHTLFQRNVEYIVQNGQVVIVDEHTGRTMPGRRWGDGLHQAVEAKEGLPPQRENQTLASTTFQNYFRLYDKLSGMTGTADTEAFELNQIYGLDVLVIPTNKPVARIDYNDFMFLTEDEKYDAIIKDIKETTAKGRPVLVGTASVEASERISDALNKAKIKHNVLNAKHHQNEAEIIENAGLAGAVTIATNMAGRGTDIKLGGNVDAEIAALKDPSDEQIAQIKQAWKERHDAVLAAGGLHIIGTERHESRRIDNQLRGRAGRQGDAGSSRFYLSLDDPLMKIFMSDRMRGLMKSLGMGDGEPLEHKMVTNSIEKAQRKVEQRNFDIRKNLLEYDNVANDQRTVVYNQRNELMESEDILEYITAIRKEIIADVIAGHIPPQSLVEQWDIEGLEQSIKTEFALELPIAKWLEEDNRLHEEKLREQITQAINEVYAAKEELVGKEQLRMFEKQVMLQVLDQVWKEHLHAMDQLRQGIHLRGYAQKNPKQEFKRESFEMFQAMLQRVKSDTIRVLSHVQVRTPEQQQEEERKHREQMAERMKFEHSEASSALTGNAEGGEEAAEQSPQKQAPVVRNMPKVGRNDPCPCGSGKKFKQCHGKLS